MAFTLLFLSVLLTLQSNAIAELTPCDQASDFTPDVVIKGQTTCKQYMDTTGTEDFPESGKCFELNGIGAPKGMVMMMAASQCCKAGSKPNGICGADGMPCAQASDFTPDKKFQNDDGLTCSQVSDLVVAGLTKQECDAKGLMGDGTRGEWLEMIYNKCCSPGSKPNGVCGLQAKTSTPCKSKADGEFLPDAVYAELDGKKYSCLYVQHTGAFEPKKESCEEKGSENLSIGAQNCCKSKEQDESVCKAVALSGAASLFISALGIAVAVGSV